MLTMMNNVTCDVTGMALVEMFLSNYNLEF